MFQKNLIEKITEKAIKINKQSKKTIVFADSDEKILKACSIIIKKKIAKPIIIGLKKDIYKLLHKNKIKNISEENIIDLDESKEDIGLFAKEYLDIMIKNGKTITIDEAINRMSKSHYYGAMLVYKDLADGMISGNNSETKPYYPVFEIIKTKEGIKRASGMFIMMKKNSATLFFSDCVMNIDPTSEQLAEIALVTAENCINFGIKPKVALLSFSTRDSAKHSSVDKVKGAISIIREKNSGLVVDGEIQVDAALVPEVCNKKCRNSPLNGEANVLIFPDLNSANIGYKLVERLGNYRAVGPIMQGLNKPVNDLSRGCSVDDVVDLTAITIIQGL